jgi:hypothetical protein
MTLDLDEALKRAQYATLLEMFESVLASYYTADNPEQQMEIGKLVIRVAAEASLRGEDSCSRDLSDRDSIIRNAVIGSAMKAAYDRPVSIPTA